jgi:hypothetical protein
MLGLTYKAREECLVAPLTGEQRHQEAAAVVMGDTLCRREVKAPVLAQLA